MKQKMADSGDSSPKDKKKAGHSDLRDRAKQFLKEVDVTITEAREVERERDSDRGGDRCGCGW